MNRFWGLLFLLVPLAGTVIYLMTIWGIPPFANLTLPRNFNLAGTQIDHLYFVIHGIGGVAFVLTGLVLGAAIWRFGGNVQQARYFAQHHALEIGWSVIAGAILVFLAFYQLQSWADNKLNRPLAANGDALRPIAKVVAKRFGWEFFHAGPDRILDTADDTYIENELHLPYGEDIVLQLESRDVIHSFFVPGLRLKQDVVPGLKQLIWFRATEPVELEIVCAELCGWGHYTMQGRLKLMARSDYDRWLADHSPWREYAQEPNE